MPLPQRSPHDAIGPYRVVRRIGAGGMGETYEAVDPDGLCVCVKLMRPELSSAPRYLRMFEDEARIHAQLAHENIVRLLDSGSFEGLPYLVLEMVDGTNLDSVLTMLTQRGETMPIAASAHILMSLTRALETAHGFSLNGVPQNLIHRDVSPSNVLLSRTGEVKLSDFGIAKSTTREPHTTAGVVRGKFAYMSPEQTRGEALDQRSDLFALGVIAYQLFTGHHPFRVGRDDNEVMTAHRMLLGERDPLGHRAPWLPKALRDETERLLEPERGARTQRARVFARALGELAQRDDGKKALESLVRRALRDTALDGASDATHTLETGGTPPSGRMAKRSRGSPGGDMVQHYLNTLPAGLSSYPSCEAKGSLVRAYLAAHPLQAEDVPAGLADTVTHPPVSGAWVPEVTFLSLALAVRERHFASDQTFLAWVKQLNAALFHGPLYRVLMSVSTTRLLAAGSELRWKQFHRGTTLVAEHGQGSSMELTFRYPAGLFTALHVRLFAAAIEAAIEAAGGKNARTESFDHELTAGRARIVW